MLLTVGTNFCRVTNCVVPSSSMAVTKCCNSDSEGQHPFKNISHLTGFPAVLIKSLMIEDLAYLKIE